MQGGNHGDRAAHKQYEELQVAAAAVWQSSHNSS